MTDNYKYNNYRYDDYDQSDMEIEADYLPYDVAGPDAANSFAAGFAIPASAAESSAPSSPNTAEKPKKRLWPILGAAALVAFVGALGVGVGYVATGLKALNASEAGTGKEIIYQSVVRESASTIATGDEPLSVAEVAAVAKQSVVEIITETISMGWFNEQVSTGAGSGVIISESGYIVTCNHVINGADSVSVRLTNGEIFEAEIIGADSKTDLAVLKIETGDLNPAILGDSDLLTDGDIAVAIGNPLGELGGSITGGYISALNREITVEGETMSLLQTDAAVNPGNSGGGLFNEYGELIGIVNAKSYGLDIEGLGFAIPSNMVKTIIEDLMEHGYVRGRVSAGFQLLDIANRSTALYYGVDEMGLYIHESVSDAFKLGDRIIAVDGEELNSFAEFKAALDGCKPGDIITITVIRDEQELDIDHTLVELKE